MGDGEKGRGEELVIGRYREKSCHMACALTEKLPPLIKLIKE
jgi:hypothetical protein